MTTASDFERRLQRAESHVHISDGWQSASETWTRASNTTATITGDYTARYCVGAKIKVADTTTKYFYVVSSTYGAPSTTVTFTGGSDYVLAGNPTAVYFSYAANPQGFPQWFNWTATPTGYSDTPTYVARFSVTGRTCHAVFNQTAGTSNATTWTAPAPITEVTATGTTWRTAYDNSVLLTTVGRVYISSGTFTAFKDMANGAWTNSGGKRISFQMSYEI